MDYNCVCMSFVAMDVIESLSLKFQCVELGNVTAVQGYGFVMADLHNVKQHICLNIYIMHDICRATYVVSRRVSLHLSTG